MSFSLKWKRENQVYDWGQLNTTYQNYVDFEI